MKSSLFKKTSGEEKKILISEKISDGELAYFDSSPDSKDNLPVLLMIHGNSGSKEMFNSIFSDLSKKNKYRCISVDLLGHGHSKGSLLNKYDFTTQATAIEGFIKDLNLSDVHILGFSLGGHIAYELLENDQVSSTITLGSPPISHITNQGKKTYNMPDWFNFANPNEAKELLYDVMALMRKEKFSEEEAKFWICDTGLTEQIPEYKSQLKAAMNTNSKARPGLFNSVMAGEGKDHKELILETEKPVCLMLGEHDFQMKKENFKKFATDADGHVTSVIIPKGQHYACYGASKEAFLSELVNVLECHINASKKIPSPS